MGTGQHFTHWNPFRTLAAQFSRAKIEIKKKGSLWDLWITFYKSSHKQFKMLMMQWNHGK